MTCADVAICSTVLKEVRPEDERAQRPRARPAPTIAGRRADLCAYWGRARHAPQALMAYNCLHRGSSTLLCNLWKEMDAENSYPEPWMDQYGAVLGP